jgi:hypothetical protein
MRERGSRVPAAVALVAALVALVAAAVVGRLSAPRADTPPVPRPAPVAEPPALGATRTVAYGHVLATHESSSMTASPVHHR